MGLRFDYENEIQFQFHLEIVPSRADGSQQIENEGPKWERFVDCLELEPITGRLVSVNV
jgi:hypothetical protein